MLYTTFVIHTLIQLLIIATGCAFLLGLRYGFIAATESDSPRKGNACLIATGMFGLIFCLPALAVILYNHSLPILENEGQVKSVQVIHGDNKHYSAFLQIHTLSSGDISIHASNRSDGFHRGEQVKFRYQGGTGELLKAWFFTADGRQEGVFNGTSTWAPYVPLLFGLFLIWGAFKQFHRDPEGAEVRIDENSGLLGTVDEESLLQLSKSKSEDCL
jgi:hypothetical protein